MCLFADLKMSLASLTADGEEQGWQQLLIQKVHYLQNYDHGGDGVMAMMGTRMMMIILCLQTEVGLVVHGKLDLRVAIGAIEDLINDIEVTRCEWIGDPKDFPLNESSESGS